MCLYIHISESLLLGACVYRIRMLRKKLRNIWNMDNCVTLTFKLRIHLEHVKNQILTCRLVATW